MWLRYRLLRPPAVLLSKLSIYRLNYDGAENAPITGPFIIVSNHQTSVDGLAIGIAIKNAAKRSVILPWAKKEIKKGKDGIIGAILWRIFNKIPIDRGAEEEAPKAIKKSLQHLRKRRIVMVFPEGTRYPSGQVGPFRYGVANLARVTPAPILPVAVYRREEDNGVQVNVGRPFFMPELPDSYDFSAEPVNKAEALILKQLKIARDWAEDVDQDKKGMKLLAKMIEYISETIERHKTEQDILLHMARPEDNVFLRNKILELLPDEWRPEDGPSTKKKPEKRKLFPA
jgi:1-acyl-sn-glycerol-3-phosphate acyltransferase